MEKAEQNGICVVMKKSMEEAQEFLTIKQSSALLKWDHSKFRIVTDMARVEDGKLEVRAGYHFIKLLRGLGYKHKVMVFGSNERLQENKKAVKDVKPVEELIIL